MHWLLCCSQAGLSSAWSVVKEVCVIDCLELHVHLFEYASEMKG